MHIKVATQLRSIQAAATEVKATTSTESFMSTISHFIEFPSQSLGFNLIEYFRRYTDKRVDALSPSYYTIACFEKICKSNGSRFQMAP
ncbi:hypothetical protein CEXT_440281 [Caerostris extrusa]|uniref:Uncharacterized protein n=1 Tax=Caerostris extrusa TaxID=172846 RepID=A0AAV4PY34_CAEEX|nr:hypothetical protein CEXT_440281 [Caerostris extrusa]